MFATTQILERENKLNKNWSRKIKSNAGQVLFIFWEAFSKRYERDIWKEDTMVLETPTKDDSRRLFCNVNEEG